MISLKNMSFAEIKSIYDFLEVRKILFQIIPNILIKMKLIKF